MMEVFVAQFEFGIHFSMVVDLVPLKGGIGSI